MTTEVSRTEAQPAAQLVFQMRELSNDTARVMREIRESGQPALITLRGRFVAVITPLPEGELESKMISAALETSGAAEAPAMRQLFEGASPRTTEEFAEELGIDDLPAYKDRDPSE
ncbi:hypothetical protein ACWGEU_11210 [Streptomyces goshikiensis]